MGIRVQGSKQGSGLMVQNGDRGSGFETRIGAGNMKQNEYQNMKHVGEWNQGRGYKRISKIDKAGDNGPNQAGPEDRRRLHAGSEAQPELGR